MRRSPNAAHEVLLPEEKVGDHFEVVAEGEVLIDGGYAERGRILRAVYRDLLALEEDLPLIRAVAACYGLYARTSR